MEIPNGQKKVQQGIEGFNSAWRHKGSKTITELASVYGVHANQISILILSETYTVFELILKPLCQIIIDSLDSKSFQ